MSQTPQSIVRDQFVGHGTFKFENLGQTAPLNIAKRAAIVREQFVNTGTFKFENIGTAQLAINTKRLSIVREQFAGHGTFNFETVPVTPEPVTPDEPEAETSCRCLAKKKYSLRRSPRVQCPTNASKDRQRYMFVYPLLRKRSC
jgi:hypothetical protein